MNNHQKSLSKKLGQAQPPERGGNRDQNPCVPPNSGGNSGQARHRSHSFRCKIFYSAAFRSARA
jgi:hypothetical protein